MTCQGTFAIISLMTAQAISGVPLASTDPSSNFSLANSSRTAEELLAEKVGISTTLAIFVGLFQVSRTG